MIARARDNTIAQVSVEKERRVRGVDMEQSPWRKKWCTRIDVWATTLDFLKEGYCEGRTSYNNNESA
jgi:hypothetical protein